MIKSISQTFMKDMREYLHGDLCGNIIREKFINDRQYDPIFDSEEPGSKEEGAYFEFLISGAVPKNGKIPQPIYMSSAVKKNGGTTENLKVDDMYENYRQIHRKADMVRSLLKEDMGLKFIEIGAHKTRTTEDGADFEGTLDLVVECVEEKPGLWWRIGDRFIIDLKYSGFLGEKASRWSKHGWKWSKVQREYHGTQAIQYHYVGSNMPFYFLVTSSTKEDIVEMYDIPVSALMMDKHLEEGKALMGQLHFKMKTGFTPRPEYSKCAKCPLYDECTDKHTVPVPVEIDLLNFDDEIATYK